MNYNEAINYLYRQLPAFEREGAHGYKPGLWTTQRLDNFCGNPHRRFRSIHIAGTNGKGSVANLLAATLQLAGYRVGLYTSPHIHDFSERIRVNGTPISHDAVAEFVSRVTAKPELNGFSFFELTTVMAFDFFAKQKVDFAVIEVGLGGRLDSTNIITPILSVITNISLDHTDLLGDTLELIAAEKAGIIKPEVPVVIGEHVSPEVDNVFRRVANNCHAPLCFATPVKEYRHSGDTLLVDTLSYGTLQSSLAGEYQAKNIATFLAAVDALRSLHINISSLNVEQALLNVASLTGFYARWTVLRHKPTVITDPAHNEAGWRQITAQLSRLCFNKLHLIIGFVADKDIDTILSLMPADATYYFTEPSNHRALDADILHRLAAKHRLQGEVYTNVNIAMSHALSKAQTDDLILVAGSFYLLADLNTDIKPTSETYD